jgi:DeoR family myo-inositol catabolism operon transcriptional repressor
LKSKRILEVEKYVQENETVSIEELTEEFNVSINTIRRDINELVKRNSVKKVYGGVKILIIKKLKQPIIQKETLKTMSIRNV